MKRFQRNPHNSPVKNAIKNLMTLHLNLKRGKEPYDTTLGLTNEVCCSYFGNRQTEPMTTVTLTHAPRINNIIQGWHMLHNCGHTHAKLIITREWLAWCCILSSWCRKWLDAALYYQISTPGLRGHCWCMWHNVTCTNNWTKLLVLTQASCGHFCLAT